MVIAFIWSPFKFNKKVSHLLNTVVNPKTPVANTSLFFLAPPIQVHKQLYINILQLVENASQSGESQLTNCS